MTRMLFATLWLAGAAAEVPADAWPLLERAGAIATAAPPSPAVSRVREARWHAEPLLDQELVESLDAARATSAALDLLDAAVASRGCRVPSAADTAASSDANPGLTKWHALVTLADHALAGALLDGADGKKGRAVVHVGRAADLVALISRCDSPSLAAFEAMQTVAERARVVALSLAEQRQIDAPGLARLVAALEPSVRSMELDRVFAAERARAGNSSAAAIEEEFARAGQRLDQAAASQATIAGASKNFDGIPVVARAAVVRCEPGRQEHRYVVSRAVADLLARRAEELLASDSLALPDLSGGSGLVVVRAGPAARSCGFRDQDLVLAVNGIELRRVEQVLVDVPAQVVRDRRAVFVVRRAGELLEWQVTVAESR